MRFVLILSIFAMTSCGTMNVKNTDCHSRTAQVNKYDDKNVMIDSISIYDTSSTEFTFLNKTKEDIKIIVSESFFVDEKGLSKNIFAEGKIADRGNKQPDISILSGAKRKLPFSVVDHINWSSGWVYEPFCGVRTNYFGKTDVSNCKGMKYIITLLIGNKKQKIEMPINLVTKLRPICEGYNLETGEKIQK